MKCETAVLQNRKEFKQFIRIALKNKVRSYLEIGSKHGGSLWLMANELPIGSRIVSVDLPNGDGSFKANQTSLEECTSALKAKGYDVHLIIGDSTDAETINKVKELAPFDLCFIDANHDLAFATKDYENYSPLASIIAFHDIAWKRDVHFQGPRMGVPELWNNLKAERRHVEIIHDHKDNGIGVLWR